MKRGAAKDLAVGDKVKTVVATDCLPAFGAIKERGCGHEAKITGTSWKAAKYPAFKWVNTMLANFKRMLLGTYRAAQPKHLPLACPRILYHS